MFPLVATMPLRINTIRVFDERLPCYSAPDATMAFLDGLLLLVLLPEFLGYRESRDIVVVSLIG